MMKAHASTIRERPHTEWLPSPLYLLCRHHHLELKRTPQIHHWRSTWAVSINWVYILRTQEIWTGMQCVGACEAYKIIRHSSSTCTAIRDFTAQPLKRGSRRPSARHRLVHVTRTAWSEYFIGRRALYSIIAQKYLHGQSIVNWQPRCLREGLEWRLGAIPGLSSSLAAFCW